MKMVKAKRNFPYQKDVMENVVLGFKQAESNEKALLDGAEGAKVMNLTSDCVYDVYKIRLVQQLKKERIKRGISQASLAEQSGVDRATIVKIESSKRKPTLDVIIRLSYAMGLTLSITDTE